MNMSFNMNILKSILYFFFGMWLMMLSACGGNKPRVDCQKSPNDPFCLREQQHKEKEQQTKAQEQVKFKSIGDCLKAKKAEEGMDSESKPTPQMVQQCIG